MKTISTLEAQIDLEAVIADAQQQPVRLIDNDRVAGVFVSERDYAAMRAFYSQRLTQSMDRAADKASAAGMNTNILDRLLHDES